MIGRLYELGRSYENISRAVIDVYNPPEVPELGNISIITSLVLIPLAIIPIIMKRRKKKKI